MQLIKKIKCQITKTNRFRTKAKVIRISKAAQLRKLVYYKKIAVIWWM